MTSAIILVSPVIHVAYLVLAHGSVGLDDYDVGDDTIYTSCSFHELSFYCLFSISPLPSSLGHQALEHLASAHRVELRPARHDVDRARYDRMELMSK